ncbi:UNVERIFIED_CONTAM: hypothetical protein Slati_2209200 [Sesamum latifolium]|uniref:Uncharacterized protein n=1 Tax=Sesamum latifolium TaxID=2727402 RepID=A0AAW2WT89_9LAMI
MGAALPCGVLGAVPLAGADDDPSGAIMSFIAGDHGGGARTGGMNAKDFNLNELLALANRVVDDRDAESWAALHSLKQRWMDKYGDGDLSTPVMGLKPVSSRQPTPFPSPARVPRHAIRSIVTAPHA